MAVEDHPLEAFVDIRLGPHHQIYQSGGVRGDDLVSYWEIEFLRQEPNQGRFATSIGALYDDHVREYLLGRGRFSQMLYFPA